MSLGEGTRLGPYEIVAPLGAGGMGEVYRARDTRLGRTVAVKVLPAAFSRDEDRLRRFEQEARAVSLLNHPNVVTLYDIGSHEGSPYVVSEFLEGATLRERMNDGPVPLRHAIDHALQIAHGLAAAHAKGVVHRDLKPENVFVTRDGLVKILDFGLAKLSRLADPEGDTMATVTPATEPGLVLGTASYMSPEQVRGEAADHRADIFAFGAMLYEMLSGQRAFRRDSAVETMSAILREDPPEFTDCGAVVPPAIERIVRHCLAKDPEKRFQSARDLAYALEALSGTTSSQQQADVSVSNEIAFRRIVFRRGFVPAARFDPSGENVYYSATWDGAPLEVFSAHPGSPESRVLGFTGAGLLSISRTGEMALALRRRSTGAFIELGTLARAPLAGGAAREILDDVHFADWSPDGKQFAIVREALGKVRLEFPIGRVLFESTGWISNPRVSPRGDAVAFLDHPMRGSDSGTVMLVDRDGRGRSLSSGWTSSGGLAWSASGEEIWFTATKMGNSRSIRAVTMDGRERTVLVIPGIGNLHDVSRSGRLLMSRESAKLGIVGRPPGAGEERDFSWLDWSLLRDVSADGRWILFDETGEGGGDEGAVYIRATDGSPAIHLGPGVAMSLSPDGRHVLSIAGDGKDMVILPTGVGEARTVSAQGSVIHSAQWHPDGKRILLSATRGEDAVRAYVLDPADGSLRAFTPPGVPSMDFRVSPDGRWIAAPGGEAHCGIYPIEEGEPRPIPRAERWDRPAHWSGDGRTLYVAPRGKLPARVEGIDLETGERTFWKDLMPADPAGVLNVGPIRMTPDLSCYFYSYVRLLSDLYVVDGVA